jgi:hypothetical protein
MLAVVVLWVFFRADSWATGSNLLGSMFNFTTPSGRAIPDLHAYYVLTPTLCFLFAICWWFPNSFAITRWVRRHSRTQAPASPAATPARKIAATLKRLAYPALAGGFLYLAVSSIGYVKSQFLYFNF